jgi:hypothetical protein
LKLGGRFLLTDTILLVIFAGKMLVIIYPAKHVVLALRERGVLYNMMSLV